MAICAYCKKEFIPKKRSAGKYCSIECCRADFKENGRPDPRSHKEAVCDWCGKVYQPKKWDTKSEHHYCSNKCQWQSMRRHPDVICPICKKKFQASDDRKKYCSWDCMYKAKHKYASESERKRAYKARWKERHKDELEDKAAALAAAREAAREAKRAERERQKLEAKRQKQLAKMHECPICGTVTTRPKFCCKACANKAENRKREIKRRHKLRENGKVDYSISLEALILRDKNVCHICKGQCDLSDCRTVDGTFIAGNLYPSIDHVLAVANGGTHQWSNVKLAHRICNSNKNAELTHETESGQLRLWV